jgi:hypothetical protein
MIVSSTSDHSIALELRQLTRRHGAFASSRAFNAQISEIADESSKQSSATSALKALLEPPFSEALPELENGRGTSIAMTNACARTPG